MKAASRSGPFVFVLICGLLLPGIRARAAVDGVEPTGIQYWSDIKSDTYEQRAHFAKGSDVLLARLDEQLTELRAKRAGLKTDTSDWDFAIKEVEASRGMLADRIRDLAKAETPEAWSDAKDKIGEAWHRSQQAVDKMNSTRTS